MDNLLAVFSLLAQAAAPAGDTPPGPPLIQLAVPIIGAIALYYFMIVRRSVASKRASVRSSIC